MWSSTAAAPRYQGLLSLEPTFPAAFFALLSTLAGAGLADDLLLDSSFATGSAELTFLLGIVAAEQARAGSHLSLCEAGLPARSRHPQKILYF